MHRYDGKQVYFAAIAAAVFIATATAVANDIAIDDNVVDAKMAADNLLQLFCKLLL
jgi:hypothetical protein